jgi:Coenzyme PQQ synthesis protein D (PqqD)
MLQSAVLLSSPEAVSEIESESVHAESVARCSTLRFYGDAFVFDTVSGLFFRLTTAASFILKCLDDGMKIADLSGALAARCHIDHATALRDIELFINDLAALEPLERFAHDDASVS